MKTTFGTGYSTDDAREAYAFMRQKDFNANGTVPGVLFHHGASTPYGTAYKAADWASQPATARLIMDIADRYPLLSGDYGYQQDLYCNDTDLLRLSSARTFLINQGAKNGKVALLGGSMGGGASMAWARANPTLVSCMVLFIPMCSINDIVVNNRLGLTAAVNAAYGGAYNDAVHGPTHSPVHFADQLAGIPTQIWYALDDAATLPQFTEEVAAAIGASAEVHAIAVGGHGDTTVAQIPRDAVTEFLRLHHASA